MAETISCLITTATATAFPHQRTETHAPIDFSQPSFTFTKDRRYKGVYFINFKNAPRHSQPLFSIFADKTSDPMVILYRHDAAPENAIGSASRNNFSSRADIEYHGLHGKMKESQVSGNHTLDFPSFALLKWHPDKWVGSSIELRDPSGKVLGKFKDGTFEKQVNIFVPCDEYFVGMIVLTAMMAKLAGEAPKQSSAGVASHVIRAVVGS